MVPGINIFLFEIISMDSFWLSFVPIFVAVDVIGLLPLFMALTEGLSQAQKHRIVLQSVVTATIVTILFILVGKFVLKLLNITSADFMIAGGSLLFLLSVNDLLILADKRQLVDTESVGAVPLGVPLLAGPALLTTTLILIDQYGIVMTIISTIANIVVAGIVFWSSASIDRILGKNGAKTISKLSSLLLAAIGVMMIRKG
ncbi:MAG TPA: MarC family protein, partial [Candidatus Margulisbacteria bacterium]|nr:MarC family protein [Candidatus Margulisiibacteriota bacterium]